jgi:cobalt/nickel transport system permease protein
MCLRGFFCARRKYLLEEDFSRGNSPVHRMDPRLKLVSGALFSVIVAVSTRWLAYLPGGFLALGLMMIARLPLRKVFMRLLMVNGLILFLWLLLPFTVGGTALWKWGPFVVTWEGIVLAAHITIRSNIILLAFLALVSTTPVFALGHAMGALGVPEKMVQLFFFTYRYLHVIHSEYQRLMRALKIRGFRAGTNLLTYRTYAYLVGMLLVRSYERAERVRQAMLCRGFNGRFYSLGEFSARGEDIAFTAILVFGSIAMVFLQWM